MGHALQHCEFKDDSGIKRFKKKKKDGLWTTFLFTAAFTFVSTTVIPPIKKSSVERDKNVAVFLQQYRANQGWGMHTDTGSLKIQVK